MSHRRHWPATWLTWFALTGCGLALALGCNPALTGNLTGSSISGLDAPDGYVVILLMNQTTASIVANVDITKQNGGSNTWALSTGPNGFYAFTQDCDIATIKFLDFGFSSVGGLTTVPSNLGTLTFGQGINCGNVITVTAAGNPPAFSVQVY